MLPDSAVVVPDVGVRVGDDYGFPVDLAAAGFEIAGHQILVLHLPDVGMAEIDCQSIENLCLQRLSKRDCVCNHAAFRFLPNHFRQLVSVRARVMLSE
ncbi:hypothetical protein D3C75_1229190 [compost metagenome]